MTFPALPPVGHAKVLSQYMHKAISVGIRIQRQALIDNLWGEHICTPEERFGENWYAMYQEMFDHAWNARMG